MICCRCSLRPSSEEQRSTVKLDDDPKRELVTTVSGIGRRSCLRIGECFQSCRIYPITPSAHHLNTDLPERLVLRGEYKVHSVVIEYANIVAARPNGRSADACISIRTITHHALNDTGRKQEDPVSRLEHGEGGKKKVCLNKYAGAGFSSV